MMMPSSNGNKPPLEPSIRSVTQSNQVWNSQSKAAKIINPDADPAHYLSFPTFFIEFHNDVSVFVMLTTENQMYSAGEPRCKQM